MTRRNTLCRLTVESLEDRRVYSVSPSVIMFDPNLTAVIQQGVNGGKDHVVVDGSQYDDTVKILYANLATGTVQIELIKGAGGTPDSDQIVTLHSKNLDPFQAIEIYAKQGNDTIINNTAVGMYVDAGDGDDYVSGGSGNDLIYGGGGRDTLMGRKGNDFIQGDAGNDYIRGGDGVDHLLGSDGDDILYGEAGNDNLDGGAGNDLMFGDLEDAPTGGRDSMHGGTGDDTMWGSGGGDQMYGDAGNDLMYGGARNDTMEGGDGNDYLDGGANNDVLRGNLGSDSLIGGAGNDYLDGGTDDPPLSGDYLEGDLGADTFVHHHHVFGNDDADVFADFNSHQGDTVDDEWHW